MTDLFDHRNEVADDAAAESTSAAARRGTERRRKAKRRAQRRRNIVSFVVMLVALALLVGGAWVLVRPLLTPDDGPTTITDYPGPGTGQVQVVVEQGDNGSDIAATLTEANVVATEGAFVSAFSANPDSGSIQPGTYALQEEMAASDAVRALLDPASRADMAITVPEGVRADDIYERIASQLEVDVADVEAAAEEVAADYLPDEADGNIEGWLRASTYNIHPDDTAQSILEKMVDRTVSTLDELEVPADQRAEILNIASIIEAEVVLPKDRSRVALVINNRLDGCSGDYSLWMDSTIVYGMDMPIGEIENQGLLYNDNAYNTRTNAGLPPTPINSPSEASIDAALNPAEGDLCYFVTVNLDTGETLFAETDDEHEQNRQLLDEWIEENLE